VALSRETLFSNLKHPRGVRYETTKQESSFTILVFPHRGEE
jgi:hypothetical protein